MKLIVQIPCYNEAETLAITLSQLPREVEGFTDVEWMVIDDGSTDGTADIARANGVDHVLSFVKHQGLARGFIVGLEACLRHGADVIVNTDADNQYNSADIPKLTAPILNGTADIVIGCRPIAETSHFSPIKKLLQKLGSWAVRHASQTDIPDAPSGFRAISRAAAMRLNVFNNYTYTLETIIQAGQKNMAITSVPVTVNEDLRPSRLVKSLFSYIRISIVTIVRIFIVYRPFRFFVFVGSIFLLPGIILGVRYLYFMSQGKGAGHIQSVIIAGLLIGIGFQTFLIAVIADLLAVNRNLLEGLQLSLRRQSIFEDIPRKNGHGT